MYAHTRNVLTSRFQSTFPRGERRKHWRCPCLQIRFNPRSHEGNDAGDVIHILNINVSIHVPTRGTTRFCRPGHGRDRVSIHVPTRGTTQISGMCLSINMFQSTFPRGERHYMGLYGIAARNSFNPRSHEGNDVTCIRCDSRSNWFQSTFPRGERRMYAHAMATTWSFNPRSHEGNDNIIFLNC